MAQINTHALSCLSAARCRWNVPRMRCPSTGQDPQWFPASSRPGSVKNNCFQHFFRPHQLYLQPYKSSTREALEGITARTQVFAFHPGNKEPFPMGSRLLVCSGSCAVPQASRSSVPLALVVARDPLKPLKLIPKWLFVLRKHRVRHLGIKFSPLLSTKSVYSA